MSPQKSFQAVLAALRQEYRDAYRNGLGIENPPERAIDDAVEEAMGEVMHLHARVTLAGALGLTPWMVAEATGAWPEAPGWAEEE